MTARKLFGAMIMTAVPLLAVTPASGQGLSAFGPVQSDTFYFKSGTSIERPGNNCKSNIDWLLVKGTGLANAKSVDVSPRVGQAWLGGGFPATSCTAPDCLPVYIKISPKDAVGAKTLTIKSSDGRTVTTTFNVVENAGRCDYPQGK